MQFLTIESTSTNLDSELKRLTMEASVMSNVIDTFRSILPSLSSKLSSIASNLQPSDDHTKSVEELVRFADKHKEVIREVGIVKHSDTLIPVPEGFDDKAKMCSYLDDLIKAAPSIAQGIQEILSEYQIVLSTFISNKDAKTSLRDHSTFYKRIQKQRVDVSAPLISYFDKGIDRSRLPFGSVYDQSMEVCTAVEKASQLNKLRSKQDLKLVKNQVAECSNILDMIVQRSHSQDITEISGAAAMDLSDGAMEVANWVELVSIFHFRMEQAIQSVKMQVEFIAKLK